MSDATTAPTIDTSIDIGISADGRAAITEGLSRLLADSYTLYLKTHNYHWNVTGPMFQTLHLMFEQQYNELALAVDEIAERIRALGAPAPASYREFGALSSVTEDDDRPEATEMVRRLVAATGLPAPDGEPLVHVADGVPVRVGRLETLDLVPRSTIHPEP